MPDTTTNTTDNNGKGLLGNRKGLYDNKTQYILKLLSNGQLEKLSLGADSEKELYTSLGISKTKWFALKKKYPELKELMIRTRYETFLGIKGAMKKRALGYDYEETEQETIVDPKTGAQKKGKTKTFTRHVPPDLAAQKLLIANLKKAENRESGSGDRNGELINWTNNAETIEVRTEGSVTVALDEAIKNVLKEITDDR